MTDNTSHDSLWRVPTYLLWCMIFAIGMAPGEVFYMLREASGVTTQRALVNSPHMITLALAIFLGFFTYFRALEAGCSAMIARGKGLQVACIGLVAFSDIPLAYLFHINEIQVSFYRNLLLGVAFVKFSAWLFALSILSRYYFFSGPAVFAHMANLLPSTQRSDDGHPPVPSPGDPE